MKRLEFNLPNDLGQLHEELMRDVPAFRDGNSYRVGGKDDLVVLDVPDDADEAAIRLVVRGHVPKPPAPPAPTGTDVIARLAAIDLTSVTSLEAWKEAVAPVIAEARAVATGGQE